MFHALGIPAPPLPGGAGLMLTGLLVASVGLVLLMLGRVVWRGVGAVVLGALGLALAGPLSARVGWNPLWLGLLLTTAGLLAGAVLARLVWAGLLTAALAMLELRLGLSSWLTPGERAPQGFDPAGVSMVEWAGLTLRTLAAWAAYAYRVNSGLAGAGAALAVLLGLVIGLIRPVVARVVLSGLLGSAMAVMGGVWVASGLAGRPLGGSAWWLAGLWIVLAGGGIAWQARAELIRLRRQEAQESAEKSSDKRQAPSAKV